MCGTTNTTLTHSTATEDGKEFTHVSYLRTRMKKAIHFVDSSIDDDEGGGRNDTLGGDRVVWKKQKRWHLALLSKVEVLIKEVVLAKPEARYNMKRRFNCVLFQARLCGLH